MLPSREFSRSAKKEHDEQGKEQSHFAPAVFDAAAEVALNGGKGAFNGKLAKWIISKMPPRKSKDNPDGYVAYVEPYFGGGSVLLAQDPEGISEAVNDLNGGLINFWRVLQSDPHFNVMKVTLDAMPFSEEEWNACVDIVARKPVVEIDPGHALAFFVYSRQSMAGRNDSFAPLSRSRTRRGMNEQVSAWLSAVEGLPAVHARLKRVVILGPKDALEVIRQQDSPKTLFCLDPPYHHEARTATDVYACEMTGEQHAKLLETLSAIKGKFLLSGYRTGLYDAFAEREGWTRHDFEIPNNSASGETKRRMVESLWTNY